MKHYGLGPTKPTTLCSASKLAEREDPFEWLPCVKELNYGDLKKKLQNSTDYHYSLSEVPHLRLEDTCTCNDKRSIEDIVAIAIANIIEDSDPEKIAPVQKKGKLLRLVCATDNVMVVPDTKQAACAKYLKPWLCSTNIVPDVAVNYALLPQEEKNLSNAIPCLLIEVWSNNILKTARQLAIKLILQLQLKKVLGFTEDEVIGFAFPQKEITESVSESGKKLFKITEQPEQEVKEENVDYEDAEEDEEGRQDASVNDIISLKKLNAVVQVNVKWNIDTLEFQITYSVLKKDEVVQKVKDTCTLLHRPMPTLSYCKQSSFITFTGTELDTLKHKFISCLNKQWEAKRSEYETLGGSETNLMSLLASKDLVQWNVEDIEIVQLASNISLIFKLSNTKDKATSLVLKSFCSSSQGQYSSIDRYLINSNVKLSLCSSYYNVRTMAHIFCV